MPTCKLKVIQFKGQEKITSKNFKFLIDTGSENSFIKSDIVIKYGLEQTPRKNAMIVGNAAGSTMARITDEIRCDIEVTGPRNRIFVSNIELDVWNTQLSYDGILGYNILKFIDIKGQNNKQMLFLHNIETSNNEFEKWPWVILGDPDFKLRKKCIVITEDVYVPPNGIAWARIPVQKKQWCIDTDFELLENGIFVNHQGKLKTDRTLIRLENHRDVGVLISAGFPIMEVVSGTHLNFLMEMGKVDKMERMIHEKELAGWRERRNRLVEETDIETEIKESLVNVPEEYKKGLD